MFSDIFSELVRLRRIFCSVDCADREITDPRHTVFISGCQRKNFRNLFIGYTVVFADADVGLELAVRSRQNRQCGDGGDFTGLPVQIVTTENIAEQMRFQILVNRRVPYLRQ